MCLWYNSIGDYAVVPFFFGGFMFHRHFWIMNVIYTEGWRTGLVVKSIMILPLNITIPFWIVRYNREEGLRIRQIEEEVQAWLDEEEE